MIARIVTRELSSGNCWTGAAAAMAQARRHGIVSADSWMCRRASGIRPRAQAMHAVATCGLIGGILGH